MTVPDRTVAPPSSAGAGRPRASAAADLPPAAPPGSSRPNVLLVLTDDQGPWALGHETPEIITPTLDRLIAEGTYLRRFFCASPVCSPARASLYTGRMPSAHGIHDWLLPAAVEPSPHPAAFLEDRESIGRLLHRGGYRCGFAGKWHVGSAHEPAAGYETWYSHRYGGGPYLDAPIWAVDEETGRPERPPRPSTEPRYFTDAIGDRALRFLDRHQAQEDERPFFLHLATTAPHDPWVGGNHPADLVRLYDGTDFPHVPAGPFHPWFRPESFPGATTDRHAHLAGYAAAVTGVDRMLARVLADLERRDLLQDTIVLFTADNGFSCGHHGIWGKGNGTFPLNFWENSIRVPFIAWGPGRIAAGRTVDALVNAMGLYETLADLTGSPTAPDPRRAGRPFAAHLRDEGPHGGQGASAGGSEDGTPIVVHDEYGGNRMIRTARHKLVVRTEGPRELYDLDADPDEEQNLAGDPQVADLERELEAQLDAFFARAVDPALDGWRLPVTGNGQGGSLRTPAVALSDGGRDLFTAPPARQDGAP